MDVIFLGTLEKLTAKIRFIRRRYGYFCVTTDLKYGRIVYSANIYLIFIMKMKSKALTVAVLGMGIVLRVLNKKPTRCYCLVQHLVIYCMKQSPA